MLGDASTASLSIGKARLEEVCPGVRGVMGGDSKRPCVKIAAMGAGRLLLASSIAAFMDP